MTRHLTVRVSDAVLRRLDAMAEPGGANRSQMLRRLIIGATLPADKVGTLPDRAELLVLLGDAARGGSVAAARLLLDELRRDEGTIPVDDFISELAARRQERR